MDLRTTFPYQVNLAVFLCFTYCHCGASAPTQKNMLEAIAACDSVKFLRNSSYIEQCSSLGYPVKFTEDPGSNDLNVMCITLNHITNKICNYRMNDTSQIKLPETTAKFDKEMRKLEPRHEDIPKVVDGWCQHMTLMLNVSILNDTDETYVKYANEILLDKTECIRTCHIRHGVSPFCAVFFWFSELYNALQSSKNLSVSKEPAVFKPEPLLEVKPDLRKQFNIQDNNIEHTSVVNIKLHKEQFKSQILDIETPNISTAELIESPNEQEVKKNLGQSEILDKEQQRQDSKLPLSTADKLNVVDNKVENPKLESQEANGDFMDEEGKKPIEEGIEGDGDRGIVEINKKDFLNDSGDQRSYLESDGTKEEDESHFFVYFSIISFTCVILYIGYHNKQKILAMVLEGRQSKRSRSNRRRPNTANYRKLDSNLEEAVTSQCHSNVTHVIY